MRIVDNLAHSNTAWSTRYLNTVSKQIINYTEKDVSGLKIIADRMQDNLYRTYVDVYASLHQTHPDKIPIQYETILQSKVRQTNFALLERKLEMVARTGTTTLSLIHI